MKIACAQMFCQILLIFSQQSVVSSKRTPLRTPVRSRRLRDRANSNKEVVNVDNTEEQNQLSSRLADHDKGDNSNKTGAKGDNSSDGAGKDGGQRELRSSDKSGSDEEKRVSTITVLNFWLTFQNFSICAS